MAKKLKARLVLLITILTLCSFLLPAISGPAYAHTSIENQSDHHFSKKNDFSDKSEKPGKMASHEGCCIGHHCCVAKLVESSEFGLFNLSANSLNQGFYVDQHIPSFHLNSLERPPKQIV